MSKIMKRIVKCRFHGKIENQVYNIGDEYESDDIERIKKLEELGVLEVESNPLEYETKVIKTRGRQSANGVVG